MAGRDRLNPHTSAPLAIKSHRRHTLRATLSCAPFHQQARLLQQAIYRMKIDFRKFT
jgi:hypothetical protein